MSQENKEQSGLILWLSQQALPFRFVSFFVFMILIIGAVIGLTGGMYYLNVRSFPRLNPAALTSTVTVAEFVTFEDEETYPSAVASASNGTLYTGSYLHGAVWRVFSNGDSFEIPQTRDLIGSVIGIDVTEDGTVYVLDHLDAFSTGGAKIWRISEDTVEIVMDTTTESMLSIGKPNDIALDSVGRLYLLDIALGQILVIDESGRTIFWQAPDASYQVTGLAYHASNDSLLVSDAGKSAVYEIPVNALEPEAERQTLFINEELEPRPSFNGITVSEDGTVYVAAFDRGEIWEIVPGTNEHTVLAGNYRGSSDVAYDSANQRLYVNNWDQSWLIPITLIVMTVDMPPRLPFSVDVIELNVE